MLPAAKLTTHPSQRKQGGEERFDLQSLWGFTLLDNQRDRCGLWSYGLRLRILRIPLPLSNSASRRGFLFPTRTMLLPNLRQPQEGPWGPSHRGSGPAPWNPGSKAIHRHELHPWSWWCTRLRGWPPKTDTFVQPSSGLGFLEHVQDGYSAFTWQHRFQSSKYWNKISADSNLGSTVCVQMNPTSHGSEGAKLLLATGLPWWLLHFLNFSTN